MKIINKLWKTKEDQFNRTIRSVSIKDINIDEFIIIDVRSQKEYKEGHIKNAINIPLYNLKDMIEEYVPSKEQKILIYCRSGLRSKKACTELDKLGYINIYNLDGGFENIDN